MYITYQKRSGGAVYAMLTRSIRKDGVCRKEFTNLGRVINKEKGIYRNKQRGLFTYNLQTGEYGACPEDLLPANETAVDRRKREHRINARKAPSLHVLRFGDIFFLDHFLKITGIEDIVSSLPITNQDTLYALLSFYILSSADGYNASEWYELSYAKVLYPKAALSSQGINETLTQIGMEESRRLFFQSYCPFISKMPPRRFLL